ncbi:hypothetical protein [Actinomadura sp. DC4]|uniref:hypothetical protein n=1 Tax=Actinomadura sp. DC4 TaxID=3055069 RepID=UPI0025B0D36E|nr:hypothetical protein [Actinomadura sp. DC4]MDN3353835.1 hypothetical protein [Actinomadura sp. DC4]
MDGSTRFISSATNPVSRLRAPREAGPAMSGSAKPGTRWWGNSAAPRSPVSYLPSGGMLADPRMRGG